MIGFNDATQFHGNLKKKLFHNILGFHVVWLSWALSVPELKWVTPLLISVVFLGIHFYLTDQTKVEISLIFSSLLLGGVMDTVLLQSNMMVYGLANPDPFSYIEPSWMIMLWACWGCTVRTSLMWLHRLTWLKYPISAVGGLLSYEAAESMGILTLKDPSAQWILLVFWGCLIPSLLWVSKKIETCKV